MGRSLARIYLTRHEVALAASIQGKALLCPGRWTLGDGAYSGRPAGIARAKAESSLRIFELESPTVPRLWPVWALLEVVPEAEHCGPS